MANSRQITVTNSRVEAKLDAVPGSHFHPRTPLKPLSTLKQYSDLFMSLSCIPDVKFLPTNTTNDINVTQLYDLADKLLANNGCQRGDNYATG